MATRFVEVTSRSRGLFIERLVSLSLGLRVSFFVPGTTDLESGLNWPELAVADASVARLRSNDSFWRVHRVAVLEER